MYKTINVDRIVKVIKQIIVCDVCGKTEDSNIYHKGWVHLSQDDIAGMRLHICSECMKTMVTYYESARMSNVGEYYGIEQEDV